MDRTVPMLEVSQLRKCFDNRSAKIQAVKAVSFQIMPGECFGLIGESGSGKSTIANMIAGLLQEDAGTICYQGSCLTGTKPRERAKLTRRMQMVFQNPKATFNPHQRLADGVAEGLRYYEKLSGKELLQRVCEALELVGLPAAYAEKYPWQLSGGECQRAAIARALIGGPNFLICDEVTSALDVSVQSQLLGMLKQLRREREMAVLFISHDLAVVSQFCDRVMVLKDGAAVEEGAVESVIGNPHSQYTKSLIDSIYSLPQTMPEM